MFDWSTDSKLFVLLFGTNRFNPCQSLTKGGGGGGDGYISNSTFEAKESRLAWGKREIPQRTERNKDQ
ncbi:hypothetical protein RUM44_013664 [Polyplax serrata]|uniref:Uncharacterized protein n=1 Tax=Polyplax serrata TaxID=468196 RepID=A0ABR1BGP7_POLSC